MSTDKIKVLNDRQQAREKLPIFFGSRDNYMHGVKELIANAADELKNNDIEEKEITVKLFADDQRIFVKDNGRGIPIDGETDGVPNYELLFLTLFAGTKYDVTDSVTTGTNGVGTCVLNYTSTYFEVRSFRNGYKHKVEFNDGGKLVGELESEKLPNASKDKTGTEVTIQLDPQVYTKTKFDKATIESIVKHFAVASNGIKYIFSYEDNEGNTTESEYFYDSYKNYFDHEVGNTSTSNIFSLGTIEYNEDIQIITENGQENKVEKNKYDIFISTNPDVFQETYLNMTYLTEGGSILEGILDGVRLYLNKYCRDNKLFPARVTAFSKDDIAQSVSLLGVVESNNVEFSNQTKLSTNKKTYSDQSKKYINELLDALQLTNIKDFKKLVKHVLEIQKYNNNNDKARARLKKKLTEKVEGIGNKVEKLVDCEEHGINSELYITEGDSAMGSIIDARDDMFQATYPLRGKMLNTLKADIERTFKNQEIVDLVKIIGTGISGSKKDDFNIDNLRYGKIIIATDADPDGFQIAILVLTFIYRFLSPLLYNGHVYIAQTPLYELKFEDDSIVYFISEDDKNKNIDKYKDKKYTMNRLKGLGEIDAKTMHETTMNPESRNILKVTVEDAKSAEKMLLRWMDKDIEPRKEMINKQLPNYIDLSE